MFTFTFVVTVERSERPVDTRTLLVRADTYEEAAEHALNHLGEGWLVVDNECSESYFNSFQGGFIAELMVIT